ncbi:Phosphotransferase system cellobiose-specific component IIB [Yersinia kristensenii ATCC 33638]|nr:Phosphotransferase system cellobiose-specific component IIB [Yersinia kristensenii ATCC 33638]
MQDHAKSIGLEVDIEALSISDAKDKVGSIDIVMLGPQVRYQKAEVEEVVNGRIPVLVIDMKDYGSMNGKAVLETALAAIQ